MEMNANELATCLEMRIIYGLPLKEAATMLRAQADLIDLLRHQPNIDYDKELLKPMFVGRELTDEEIKELWKPFPDTKYYDSDILNFAKAILRKAQEK